MIVFFLLSLSDFPGCRPANKLINRSHCVYGHHETCNHPVRTMSDLLIAAYSTVHNKLPELLCVSVILVVLALLPQMDQGHQIMRPGNSPPLFVTSLLFLFYLFLSCLRDSLTNVHNTFSLWLLEQTFLRISQ